MSSVRGILLKITALALFTVMAALVKAAMESVPPGQAVFFRALFSLPIIFLWLAYRRELATGLRTKKPILHVWRGLIGGVSMGATFFALGHLPLPEVTIIGFVSPIITLMLAVFLLGETVRVFRWSMVALGLAGVLIVVWPRLSFGGENIEAIAVWAVFAVLVSACLRALVQIHIRRMVKTEQTSAIVFYFAVTVSMASLLTAPFGWIVPDGNVLFLLVASGIVGGVAQLFITTAFRYSDASVLAPFDYISILFSMIVGYFWFTEVPTRPMLIGASLVVLSGVLIILRERQIGIKARQDKVSVTPQG
ncbi:MAG: DMT family transporter [Paracoccaceae bacterium]|nr:DMT family transporter [Paracoccaceae bacterium]